MSKVVNLGPAKRIDDILRPQDPPQAEKKKEPKPEKPPKEKPPKEKPPAPLTITAQSPFRELGNTDRASFMAALSRSIGITPAPPSLEADTIFHNLEPYGLTRLAAAMAWIERHNETYPPDEAYYPRSLHNLWAVKKNGAWARYPSYADAAKDWASIVLGRTYADLTSIAEFISRYAPSFENDTSRYIALVVDEVSRLPFAGGVTPVPDPEPDPEPQKGVFELLFGGKPYTIITQMDEPTNLGYYDYYSGHGGDPWHHPGLDVSAGLGATLYAPFPGVITCAGTGGGSGSWGTSCAAFAFVSNFSGAPGGGAGRVEILHDDGNRSLVLGHCLRALSPVGTKVKTGDPVATQGGANSSHVHAEARRWLGRDYTIEDPRVTFGGGASYAPRQPIPQPSEFDVSWTITVAGKRAPVLQRADLGAAKVGPDLKKGETFEATYLVIANDGTPYWISTNAGRVPMDTDAATAFKELLKA